MDYEEKLFHEIQRFSSPIMDILRFDKLVIKHPKNSACSSSPYSDHHFENSPTEHNENNTK